MEFGLSEEQRLLQASLSGYFAEHASLDRVRHFADKDEGRAKDIELWRALHPCPQIDELDQGKRARSNTR